MSMKYPDYDNIDVLDDALFDDFKKAVLNETKIVKKTGFIFYEFSCSYKQDSEWKILSGLVALNGADSSYPPEIAGIRDRLNTVGSSTIKIAGRRSIYS